MEEINEPVEPSQKAVTWSEKNLGKAAESSFKCVLSFNSDSTSFRSDSTSNFTQFGEKGEEEEEAVASTAHLQMLVKKKLSNLPGEPHKSQPITVYRVPASFREKRKTLYEPRMVSIGPYYRGRKELEVMEEHKWWCLRDFQSRKPEIGIDIYLGEMRRLESRARQCYSESVKLGTDAFAFKLVLYFFSGQSVYRLLLPCLWLFSN